MASTLQVINMGWCYAITNDCHGALIQENESPFSNPETTEFSHFSSLGGECVPVMVSLFSVILLQW